MCVANMMCFEESSTATIVSKCTEDKCELVEYSSLPDFMKHNEFILGYYRSEWPLKQSILSIFAIHNETLNVWTHLIGFFVFLALATFTATMVPLNSRGTSSATSLQQSTDLHLVHLTSNINMSHPSVLNGRRYETITSILIPQFNETVIEEKGMDGDDKSSAVARWPFYAYLCGAMFCLLMSSACHLLSCHSEHTCYVMLRLDYAGITTLIVTSFYPVVYYSFACDPFIRNIYFAFITVFGLATVLVSLVPVFETPGFRIVRAALFAGMGVSGLVPILHKVLVFGDRPEAVMTAGYEMVMGVFYGVGVVVYALRIPERWMPGMFDLVGNSHQLFHVMVVAGAYTHYLAGLVYLSWRDSQGC